MASELNISYADQLYKQFGFRAHYPPEKDIRIGDIGTMEGNLFRRKDNLVALTGLNATARETIKEPGDKDNYYYLASEGKTEVNTKAKGDSGLVHIGLEVRLTNANSIFFSAANITVQEIESQIVLGNKIMELFKEGKWEKEWVLVTAVYISKSTLIFGSANGNSTILLEAKSDVPSIDLGQADLQLGIKKQSTLEMNIVDYKDNICLLETASIKRKGRWPFRKKGFGFTEANEPSESELLDRIRNGKQNMKDHFEFSKD